MTHFLRGKQAGIHSDLSAGLSSDLFVLDHVAQYGIRSQIAALAYDPTQSLLAVGTNDSKSAGAHIYVFGQKRVCVTLTAPKRASVRVLQFCADKLISLDSKNDIAVFSLETKQLLSCYAPPGHVTALLTDPTLDYALIGLQNGEVIAYDLDRQRLAPFKIPNLWRERSPRVRLLPVVALALHPRDIGTLLIGYSDGAVIFSFKQDKPLSFFQYELQPGAPGGQSDPSSASGVRYPKVTQAVWHPTGTFFLTGHDDSSMVIWDPKSGKVILARTLQDSHVDEIGSVSGTFGSTPGTFSLKAPLFRIAWCSQQNPEDTGMLIAGGAPTNLPTRGLTFIDLGPTPVYTTSSWQVLSEHFEKPRKQHILPTPPDAEVVDFCLVPRSSPHYAGSHDPIAVIALLASGEIFTLSFPSGNPITPTNQLHASLTFVHPFANTIALACVERTRWLGMTEKRSHGPAVLKGGAEARYPLKRYESRNILQTAHADGTIRIWDAGHGDEIENGDMLQVDVARALERLEDVEAVRMSMSGATGELGVGLKTGEVVVFRWGHNPNYNQELPHVQLEAFGMESIKDRADPSLREGLIPLTLLARSYGPVTAIKMSDIGFLAAGSESGSLTIIDLRGPAVIIEANLQDFVRPSKHGSVRRSSSDQTQVKPEWSTVIEFGVMSLEGENYSSILVFVGTNLGRLATFKLLPSPQGGYSVQLAGVSSIDDNIICICAVSADTGKPASASQTVVANLRDGYTVNGVLLVVTQGGARIFKPATAKGASKTWNECLCDSANVVQFEDRGFALVGLFGDGSAKAFSIPSLKEIASIEVGHNLDVRRFAEAIISPTGDIFGWSGPSEISVLNVWGRGRNTTISLDKLYNPDAIIPPRPTISHIQWISGTQHVTPSDMDMLIGGPDRPPSKRMMAQLQSEELQRRTAARSNPAVSSSSGGQEEGYWAYMQRQVQERTERLNLVGDSIDKLEENSMSWTDDVSKYVGKQKKKAVLG
ncbi:MAG: hypothetical protein Q9187_000287, partial [Circinaria calcarea]